MRAAFTLAEVLVTLTILGILASIIVPNVAQKQVEKANKTKIKKALSVYEAVVNKIVLENAIKSQDELDSFIKNDSTCSNARKYFKITKTNSNTSCRFATADGLWWDVGIDAKMSKPMVYFKNIGSLLNIAPKDTDFRAFYFITKFDENGTVRVNDIGNAYDNRDVETISIVTKILAYLNNKSVLDYYKMCENGEKKSCIEITSDGAIFYSNTGSFIYKKSCDENGINCGRSQISEKFYSEEYGGRISLTIGCNSHAQNCTNTGAVLTKDNILDEEKEVNLNIAKLIYPDGDFEVVTYRAQIVTYSCEGVVSNIEPDKCNAHKKAIYVYDKTSNTTRTISSTPECFENPTTGCVYKDIYENEVLKEL